MIPAASLCHQDRSPGGEERDPYEVVEVSLVGSASQMGQPFFDLTDEEIAEMDEAARKRRANPLGFAGTHDPEAGRWPVVPRFDLPEREA